MKKINCRIISVDSNDHVGVKSVQKIGTASDSNGNKIRYKQRRDVIEKFLSNFESESISIECFNAVTPNLFNTDIDMDVLSGSITFEDKKYDLNGELWICYIANFLSHYQIWNIDEDTLILEDDVIFDDEFFKKIHTIIHRFLEIEEDNKILYLQSSIPWLEDAREKYFNLSRVNDHIGKYISGDTSGTSAYYITKECKKIILNNITKITNCDGYLSTLLKMGIVNYYIPNDSSMMCKLDKKTMLL
jgi:GR25 family glycosyltransferase involved in LPS biosynthesis